MTLHEFIAESNRIEGISGVSEADMAAHTRLLDVDELRVQTLITFVDTIAGARIREAFGMDVRIGGHRPPPGGPAIPNHLAQLLEGVNGDAFSPWKGHVLYETLHPFMDGNGRSGRAIWAWHMNMRGEDPFALGFLHRFYYQTLSSTR